MSDVTENFNISEFEQDCIDGTVDWRAAIYHMRTLEQQLAEHQAVTHEDITCAYESACARCVDLSGKIEVLTAKEWFEAGFRAALGGNEG